MATARRLLVAANITRYYHCTSRCVRGAYLCGKDATGNKDYSHRREWLRNRLLFVSEVFSLQVVAYSIMENHFHVIVKLDPDSAGKLSDMETVLRWHKLFKGNSLSRRFSEGEPLDNVELKALQRIAVIWRNQLCDIGWFMRCIKEPLARMANREDNCKGRFWEGRFHSQALLDDQAVAACMVYVDLNPLRAGMCEYPEDDEHTSLFARTSQIAESTEHNINHKAALLPFSNTETRSVQSLPFTQTEYLNLLDNAARLAKPGKRGQLDSKARHILGRLGIMPDHWGTITTEFEQRFHRVVGETTNMLAAMKALGTSRAWGYNACRQFFQKPANQA